jgi:sugar/nucleoside kinase (ribokinase family)
LAAVLATVGDLVDDIVVRLGGPIHVASDTEAIVERRRGGSAANVASMAARISGVSRFLGQVGDDTRGAALLSELTAEGVDVSCVRRAGRTGSIVVLVDGAGERSFLTDPGSARDLADPSPEWLDGAGVLHIPLYSLAAGAIVTTSRTLIEWAHARGIAVSIDLSSVSVIESIGKGAVRRLLEELAPDAIFANADEAKALQIDATIGKAVTIVKAGAGSVTVLCERAAPIEIQAHPVGAVVDTTGAGDAFAAGVLTHAGWQFDTAAAIEKGHAAAAELLQARSR